MSVRQARKFPTRCSPRCTGSICSTIEKLYWGRQYLTPEFFDLMRKTFKRNMVFIERVRRAAN